MIFILIVIVIILLYFLVNSNQEKESNKILYEKEVLKLERLRKNPELNEKYSKCMSICKKIASDFSNVKTKDESHFRFKIHNSSPYSGADTIHARGWISIDEFLTTDWVLGEQIIVSIKYENSSRKDLEKRFELHFNRNESDILILKKIYDSIGKIK